MDNTYNILARGVEGYDDADRLSDILSEIIGAINGDLIFSVSPATVTSDPTSAAWTRTVTISLVDTDGRVHEWFTQDIATGVSIADTSTAGTASIESTTLSFVDGVATVVVSGDAADWLDTETDTLTVAEATILGYTVAAKTSVETFTA